MYHLARRFALPSAQARHRGGSTIAIAQRPSLSPFAYVICTNPRSGSWLLSEGLAATGLAGNPREWLNTLEEQRQRAVWRMHHSSDLGLFEYLKRAREEASTPNGISGIKVHLYQLVDLAQRMAPSLVPRRLSTVDVASTVFANARYIWLTRRDKERQAISLLIASRTNDWWAIDGIASDRQHQAGREPAFDARAIAKMETALRTNDLRWQAIFKDRGIRPLTLYYEELAGEYASNILRALKWLEIPNVETLVVGPPRLNRQSSARNEEWLERYQAFKKTDEGLALTSAPEGDDAMSALHARVSRPLAVVPDAWKAWIAQSKLQNSSSASIVDVLEKNGYARSAAQAEVARAAVNPYLAGATYERRRLGKCASMLRAVDAMSRLDSRNKTIDRRMNLSREEFLESYYAANRPVLIQGLLVDWRAPHLWTPNYLKSVAGDEIIEFMAGRDVDPNCDANAAKHRSESRFADFIDKVYSGKMTNDYYMGASNVFFQKTAGQSLLKDFKPFAEYLHPSSDGRQCFLWFGPAGTVTSLHHDTSNILMAQVRGRKRYRLVPPCQTEYVYHRSGVFSDVDCEHPDYRHYPKFRQAVVTEVVVEPGEVLFMPVGWWHHVRALDVSMTIAFTNFAFPNHFTWEP
ncbi:MAG TPA: Stf0 family sulfotransferase [Steroidobacteraceae bacterium]